MWCGLLLLGGNPKNMKTAIFTNMLYWLQMYLIIVREITNSYSEK